MAETRRTFTREYKLSAVKLVTEQGRSFSEAARSLGLADGEHDDDGRDAEDDAERREHGAQPVRRERPQPDADHVRESDGHRVWSIAGRIEARKSKKMRTVGLFDG